MFYIDRTTKQYPLNRWEVMSRNPDIGGAINWDDATLAALNVWPVWARATAVRPNYDQDCIESEPIEIDGSWYQNWIVVPLPQSELDSKIADQWQAVIQAQQAILATNVEILPSGNVVVRPIIQYNYDLPSSTSNVVINDGNVYLNNILISTNNVIVNGESLDVSINQAVIGSDISLITDGIAIASTAIVEDIAIGSNVSIVALGNVEIVNPYPQITVIPYVSLEIPKLEYESYINSVSIVTSQSNPFEIIWPTSPFGTSSTTSVGILTS